MTVASDLMRSCLVVREDATVAEVVDRIDQWAVCIVVDHHDRVTGILTEHDLARLVYGSGQLDGDSRVAGHLPAFLGMTPAQLRAVPVTELMTPEPDSISPDTEFDEILQAIFRQHRDVLPVVKDHRLLGVVHRMDVIKKVLG
ncbi:MAG TPA: CBS domain-containing protein [Symbiobacteriaceae bacterium]|jgi:CBS domain-containing protein|nr:CBS domain-containing protein [Symbiobacteriaceae bacterium]